MPCCFTWDRVLFHYSQRVLTLCVTFLCIYTAWYMHLAVLVKTGSSRFCLGWSNTLSTLCLGWNSVLLHPRQSARLDHPARRVTECCYTWVIESCLCVIHSCTYVLRATLIFQSWVSDSVLLHLRQSLTSHESYSLVCVWYVLDDSVLTRIDSVFTRAIEYWLCVIHSRWSSLD